MIKWFYLFMYSIILLFSNQSPDEFGHRNLSSLKLQILISWYQLQCIVPETGRKGKLVILRSNKERREGIIPVQWKPKSVISELWYWGDVGIQQHLIGSSSWCQSRSCWWWCNADFCSCSWLMTKAPLMPGHRHGIMGPVSVSGNTNMGKYSAGAHYCPR